MFTIYMRRREPVIEYQTTGFQGTNWLQIQLIPGQSKVVSIADK